MLRDRVTPLLEIGLGGQVPDGDNWPHFPAQAFGIGQDGGAERMEFVAFAVPWELMGNPAPGV